MNKHEKENIVIPMSLYNDLIERMKQLEERNKELEQEIDDLKCQKKEIIDNKRVSDNAKDREIAHLKMLIESYKNNEQLKTAEKDYKEVVQMLKDAENREVYFKDKLKRKGKAGRNKNYHLRTYLLSCWAKEMTDKEIIGSEYDGYNGKEKVTRASYYRAKKELYQKE